MDLRDFYLSNIQESEYHYRFYESITNVNRRYNVFSGYEESDEYAFEIYDVDEAIAKFRELCQPEVSFCNNEEKCWFYLVTYYLDKSGYEIKEFPRVLARPPVEPYDFTYAELRNRILSQGRDDNGSVRYAVRRQLIASLTFEKKARFIDLDESINDKFIEISNRQAAFNRMSTDEKLSEITNLIENLLKKGGKFISIDYSKLCLGFISDDMVTKYRKQMQCFRHATDEALAERNSYSEDQKNFLIDLGLTIVKAIHSLLKE